MARTKWSVKRQVDKKIDEKAPRVKQDGTAVKPRRWKSGTVARREIRRFQGGTHATLMLVPKRSLDKLIVEIMQGLQSSCSQISPRAREALRVSSEEYLTGIFNDANEVAGLRKAETVNVDDFNYAVKHARTIETVMRNST